MENKNKKNKKDLRDILYCFQYSQDYGLCIGENLRDPRNETIDDYWLDIGSESGTSDSIGLSGLFRKLEDDPQNEDLPISESGVKQFNLLSCMLKRISKRIDRLLLE